MEQWARNGHVVQKTRDCEPKSGDRLNMIRDDSVADIGPKPRKE
jgi:hypothetical protein